MTTELEAGFAMAKLIRLVIILVIGASVAVALTFLALASIMESAFKYFWK